MYVHLKVEVGVQEQVLGLQVAVAHPLVCCCNDMEALSYVKNVNTDINQRLYER